MLVCYCWLDDYFYGFGDLVWIIFWNNFIEIGLNYKFDFWGCDCSDSECVVDLVYMVVVEVC